MMKLASHEIEALDPYVFMATLGKQVIHPGGRSSTDALLRRADIGNADQVLDVGCGVGTTAVEIARRHKAQVEAVDISPLMLERAAANVTGSGMDDRVTVRSGDILELPYPQDFFDVVIAEAVTMFVDRARAASELIRVVKPGGKVLATEFFWREPPTPQARQIFLGQVCPGLEFDTVEDWQRINRSAGLVDLETETGPFEMMTPRGFLTDEGLGGSLAIMSRVMARPANLRKMAWLMPRMSKAVPYLGYILIAAEKPSPAADHPSDL
jgi:SAM-dependent methyltransferase